MIQRLKRRSAVWASLLVCINFVASPDVSAQQSSSSSIVGRWRSLETSKGGLGAMYEFHSDGVADFSPGAVVEMQWHIENGELLLPPATVGGAEQKFTLSWLGDNKLNLANGTPGGVELTRVGVRGDEHDPIIGEWLENRAVAGRTLEAHWLFYRAGKLLFLLPFAPLHGTYKVSGPALHVEIPGVKANYKFEVTDDLLTLSDPDGSHAYRYARY